MFSFNDSTGWLHGRKFSIINFNTSIVTILVSYIYKSNKYLLNVLAKPEDLPQGRQGSFLKRRPRPIRQSVARCLAGSKWGFKMARVMSVLTKPRLECASCTTSLFGKWCKLMWCQTKMLTAKMNFAYHASCILGFLIIHMPAPVSKFIIFILYIRIFFYLNELLILKLFLVNWNYNKMISL